MNILYCFVIINLFNGNKSQKVNLTPCYPKIPLVELDEVNYEK